MIKPILDRIVVKPIKTKDLINGVFVSKELRKKWKTVSEGEIIAVGGGKHGENMPAMIGDTVVFPKFGGLDVEIDGEDYTVIRLHEVIALK